MDYVYIPTYNAGNCAYIYNSDIIRVYSSQPRQNATITYKDYYYNSHYLYNEGSTTFSNYSTLPTCLSDSRVTTEYFYRTDYPTILLTSFALIFFVSWFIIKLIRTVFLGWRWA